MLLVNLLDRLTDARQPSAHVGTEPEYGVIRAARRDPREGEICPVGELLTEQPAYEREVDINLVDMHPSSTHAFSLLPAVDGTGQVLLCDRGRLRNLVIGDTTAGVNARTLAALGLIFLVACTSGSSDSADGAPTPGRQTASAPDGGGEASNSEPGEQKGDGVPSEPPEEGSLTIKEPANDATTSGDVADYPELSSARLNGSAEGVQMDIAFARSVPQELPKAVQMTVALSIIDDEGGRYLLNALGGSGGWDVTVVTGEGQARFGGLFEIKGKRMTLGIPWSDLGGPRPFNWIVSSSWTGDADEGMSYGFDSIPDQGFEGYPAPAEPEKSP
jgi:hypothetical protein